MSKLDKIGYIFRKLTKPSWPPPVYDDVKSPVFHFSECPHCLKPHSLEIILKGHTSALEDIDSDAVLEPDVMKTLVVECSEAEARNDWF